MGVSLRGLVGLGLLLGARHAVDWDHIAAITDFLGSDSGKRKGFLLSLFYILGHESVNLVLGIVAILIGKNLPNWIDNVMERVVGLLLVILGVWLIFILLNSRGKPVLVSRWKLLFIGLRKLGHALFSRAPHQHLGTNEAAWDLGLWSAYAIGVLHGIGGETGTQILLFMTAAGAGTLALGMSAVFSFILGLFLAQLLMIVGLLVGYAKVASNQRVYKGVAILTSLYSLGIGAIFLAGKSSLLP